MCRLPKFNSGIHSKPLDIYLALIPSKIKNKDYNGINFRLISGLKIEDKVRFESKISSTELLDIYFARKVSIIDEKINPWILFISAGFEIFVLIITLIILIRVRINLSSIFFDK